MPRPRARDDRFEARGGGDTIEITFQGEPWVTVKRSGVLPEEEGLFAARDFPKEATIGVYFGEEVPDDEHPPSVYTARVIIKGRGAIWVDAADEGAPYVHKINSSKGIPGAKSNCKMLESGRIVTTKLIRVGTELLMSYGSSYWLPWEAAE